MIFDINICLYPTRSWYKDFWVYYDPSFLLGGSPLNLGGKKGLHIDFLNLLYRF